MIEKPKKMKLSLKKIAKRSIFKGKTTISPKQASPLKGLQISGW